MKAAGIMTETTVLKDRRTVRNFFRKTALNWLEKEYLL
jgi:hypothetical protein